MGNDKCGSMQERGDSTRRIQGQTSAGLLITVGTNALTAAFLGSEKWTRQLGNGSDLVGYRELTMPEHLAQIRAC